MSREDDRRIALLSTLAKLKAAAYMVRWSLSTAALDVLDRDEVFGIADRLDRMASVVFDAAHKRKTAK